jgi:hypothetical protein
MLTYADVCGFMLTRQVPTLGGGASEMRAVVFREAESKFPAAAWAKYEVKTSPTL